MLSTLTSKESKQEMYSYALRNNVVVIDNAELILPLSAVTLITNVTADFFAHEAYVPNRSATDKKIVNAWTGMTSKKVFPGDTSITEIGVIVTSEEVFFFPGGLRETSKNRDPAAVEDIKFLLGFVPATSVDDVQPNLGATFYHTGTYSGDLEIVARIESICKKYGIDDNDIDQEDLEFE